MDVYIVFVSIVSQPQLLTVKTSVSVVLETGGLAPDKNQNNNDLFEVTIWAITASDPTRPELFFKLSEAFSLVDVLINCMFRELQQVDFLFFTFFSLLFYASQHLPWRLCGRVRLLCFV